MWRDNRHKSFIYQYNLPFFRVESSSESGATDGSSSEKTDYSVTACYRIFGIFLWSILWTATRWTTSLKQHSSSCSAVKGCRPASCPLLLSHHHSIFTHRALYSHVQGVLKLWAENWSLRHEQVEYCTLAAGPRCIERLVWFTSIWHIWKLKD